MTPKYVLQKIAISCDDDYVMAEKYYSVLSILNGLHLTEREIQLVAFTAIRGNISYGVIREEFCKKHGTSSPTINNMISRLKRIRVLVKEGGKVKVNPVILLKFENDVLLEIMLKHGQTSEPAS